MSNTHIEQVNLSIPNGWKIAPGNQPRKAEPGEWYWHVFTEAQLHNQRTQTVGQYIILIPDLPPIDTTTEEYQVEVYRQWRRGKAIEYRFLNEVTWRGVQIRPAWDWVYRAYRVKPTCKDEHGHPCYESKGKKVRVPE
jgi:hypothetical protein